MTTLEITSNNYNYRNVPIRLIKDDVPIFTVYPMDSVELRLYEDEEHKTPIEYAIFNCYTQTSLNNIIKLQEHDKHKYYYCNRFAKFACIGYNMNTISMAIKSIEHALPITKSINKVLIKTQRNRKMPNMYSKKSHIALCILDNTQIYNKINLTKVVATGLRCGDYVIMIVLSSQKSKNKKPFTLCDPTIVNTVYKKVIDKYHDKIHVLSYFKKPRVHQQRMVLNMVLQFNRIFSLNHSQLEYISETLFKKQCSMNNKTISS